jgi:hypothetical protein
MSFHVRFHAIRWPAPPPVITERSVSPQEALSAAFQMMKRNLRQTIDAHRDDIAAAMKPRGGKMPGLIRLSLRAPFGRKPIRCHQLLT